MVVSKRCKICSTLHEDNIPISGEYFGNQIPDLIEKVSGIELDPGKIAAILICQQCAILLVHTQSVVSKLQKSLMRLKKANKTPKQITKTPSKNDATPKKGTSKKVQAAKENGDVSFKKIHDDSTLQADELTPAKKKKSAKRKLNALSQDEANETVNGCAVAKCKQEFNDDDSHYAGSITIKESPTKGKMRYNAISLNESVLEDLVAEVNETSGEQSFKKITDDSKLQVSELTPAKKKKRAKSKSDPKIQVAADGTVNGEAKTESDEQAHYADSIVIDTSPIKEKKRSKTTSFNESVLEDQMAGDVELNVTSGEQSLKTNKTKKLNCVLCEKKFNQKSTLREHIETSHMGEKLKECPNCSMEFRSLQKYELHVFGETCKSTLHLCQYENCHKRFKSVSKMEAHMREKHLSQNVIDSEYSNS